MNTSSDRILYLTRNDVLQACQHIDSVAVIREMFLLHEAEQTILPDEAYLSWTNAHGESARSLNMPGYVGGAINCIGTKIINGNINNYKRGYPRASGLTLLHNPITARTFTIMEGAYISSLRTASVSLLAAEELKGPDIQCAGIIGAGAQSQAHIELLLRRREHSYPHLRQIVLFDISHDRIADLHATLSPALKENGVHVVIASTPEEVVRKGQLVIAATTVTEGYIQYSWLQPGTILVNVSLDDVLPEVVFRADKVIVDDWNLVKNDPRRLIGRMYLADQVIGPDEKMKNGDQPCRRIDAQLGEILAGTKIGRHHIDDILLVNPFGLAIEDVALAACVYSRARELNTGLWLER